MAIKPLFMSGTHRTPYHQKVWTAADVDAVFEASIANSPEHIPFVIGHTANDLPVVGLLTRSALVRQGEGDKRVILYDDAHAQFGQAAVDAALADGYKHVSVKIKMPERVIKNIALVKEAAISALNDENFPAGEEPEFEYAVFEADALFGTHEYRVPWIGSLFRNLRDWMIGKYGKDEADTVIPSSEVDWLMERPEQDAGAVTSDASFSTTTTDKSMTEAEKQKMDQLEAENARLAGLVQQSAEAQRTAAIDAVFGAPEHAGKITDKNKSALRLIAEGLVPADATFGVGDDPLKVFKDLLATMPVTKPADGSVATFASSTDGEPGDASKTRLRAEISAVTGD